MAFTVSSWACLRVHVPLYMLFRPAPNTLSMSGYGTQPLQLALGLLAENRREREFRFDGRIGEDRQPARREAVPGPRTRQAS